MADACEFGCPSASACQGACFEPERPPVVCEACGGDGGFEVADTGPYGHRYDPRDGGLITHWSDCRACDGSGWVEDDSAPLTEEDAADRDFEISMAEVV